MAYHGHRDQALPKVKKEGAMETKKTQDFQFCINLSSIPSKVRERLTRYLKDQGFCLTVNPENLNILCLRIDVSNKVVNGARVGAEFYHGRHLVLSLEDWEVLLFQHI
jgi:hypothetical protein